MKIDREQLLTVSSLELSGVLNKMDDSQLDEYRRDLGGFIVSFPEQERKLKKFFEDREWDAFSKTLLPVMDTLTKIHATALAQDSLKLLSEIRAQKHQAAEVLLASLLASVSALSIDIQMAYHKIADDTNAAPTAEEAAAVPAAEEAAGAKADAQKSILAVDDVSFLLSTLKAALLNTAYKFVGVTSGNAALRFAEKHRPDLFILDIEMPEMDGYTLARRLRELGQTAPIIFLTSNATTEYVLKAIQAGGTDFIVKPVNKEQVLEKIKRCIG